MNPPRDVMVTVPAKIWPRWLAEGDLPGDPPEESGMWDFSFGGSGPREAGPGSRLYVVAHGYLRGYAEITSVLGPQGGTGGSFVRGGGAVACTLREPTTGQPGQVGQPGAPLPIDGFRGWRYATFPRDAVTPWEGWDWATFGVAPREQALVRRVLAARAAGPAARSVLRRRVLGGLPIFLD